MFKIFIYFSNNLLILIRYDIHRIDELNYMDIINIEKINKKTYIFCRKFYNYLAFI